MPELVLSSLDQRGAWDFKKLSQSHLISDKAGERTQFCLTSKLLLNTAHIASHNKQMMPVLPWKFLEGYFYSEVGLII